MLAINQIAPSSQLSRQSSSVSSLPSSLNSSSYSASLAKTESKYLGSVRFIYIIFLHLIIAMLLFEILQKKPVTRLRYSIVMRQLLALCDSTLYLIDVYKFDVRFNLDNWNISIYK